MGDLTKTGIATRAVRVAKALAVPPRLLGMGLFLAWVLSFPRCKGLLWPIEGSSPVELSSVSTVVEVVVLLVAAFAWGRRGRDLTSAGSAKVAASLGVLAQLFLLLGDAFPGAVRAVVVASALAEGAAISLFFLMWNEVYAKYPARSAWPSYAASYAIAPLVMVVVSAAPVQARLALTLLLPPLSALFLTGGGPAPNEPLEPEPVSLRASCVRPAVLMACFSFVYYMFTHLEQGTGSWGRVGSIAAPLIVLVLCAASFDRFDLRSLYKLAPVLMIGALLLVAHPNDASRLAADFCANAAFYGFTLFTLFILNSTCSRFQIKATWLFGVVQAVCVLFHMVGASVGASLVGANAVQGEAVRYVVDGAIVVLVLLDYMLFSAHDQASTWGIPQVAAKSKATVEAAEKPSNSVRAAHPVDLAWQCSRVARHYGLTHREEQVLELLAGGFTTQQICDQLYIAYPTAKGHVQHVYAKLGVHSREEAFAVVVAIG